jgi:AsmA protein
MRLLLRLAGLVIVTIVVGVISLLLLPAERIASIAADQISKQTGREVTLEGETRITLWPILGVSTERFIIANAPWSDAGPMLSAEALKIGVAPQALWGGAVRITGLEAASPMIRLERSADGKGNWDLGVDGIAPSGQGSEAAPASLPRLALTLDRALLTDATVSYRDHGTGQGLTLTGLALDLRWPDPDGAASFAMSVDALAPGESGERITLEGELDPARTIMEGGLSAVTARITAPGGGAGFVGRISTRPEAQGQFSARLEDTARFLAAMGFADAAIPAGLGQSAEIDTQLTWSADRRLALRETRLTLDNNHLAGAADLDFAPQVPRVSARIRAEALDLTGLVRGEDGSEGGRGGAASGANGWSTASIDASALALVEGEFALVADKIALGDLSLGTTRTKATLDRSRLVFDIVEMALYEGALSGQFVINNRSGLSVGGDLRAEGLALEPLLKDTLDVSRLQGKADAQLQFLGVGQSMDSIMRSLSGSGSIASGRGVIDGFDLDRIMRSGDLTGGTTVFDQLTASFTIDGGNLRNSDMLMTLPRARAEGEGRVGLGERDLDYRFTPVLLDGDRGQRLAIPVRIAGPWHNPRITPDLERAIDLNLRKEREALEERVRSEREKLEERAREEIEDRLGVPVEPNQSVEDVLRDAIEEQLGRGLLRLLD